MQLKSYNIVSTTRVGRTTFDYVFAITLKNNTSAAWSDVKFELFNAPANITILSSDVSFTTIGAGESATSIGTLKVRIDRSSATDLYSIPWRITSDQQKILGDFNGDGTVDFADLRILASQWLQSPGNPSADIAPPPNGDGMVNFLDFALFAQHWLEGITP